MAVERSAGVEALAQVETAMTLLPRVSAEATCTAYHVLDAHIFGFSLWAASHTMSETEAATIKETVDRVLTSEEYPYLREHAEQHFGDGAYKNVSAFELGLDLILDGLKKIHGAGA